MTANVSDNAGAMPRFGLENRSVLVTGGGRGIGRAICLRLGAERAWVGVGHTGSAESEGRAAEVCRAIEAAGGRALSLKLDVNFEADIDAALEQMTKTFGGLNGIVNNGGLAVDQLAMRTKIEDWDRTLDTNLRGAFLLSKAAFRPLSKSGHASIVNMSSVVGLMGNPGQAAYAASKAGLIGLTKALAKEFAPRSIRVNAVAPGFIETDMTNRMPESTQAEYKQAIPLKAFGSPDDIANGTLFLLSDASKYVTGHVLSINGGLYM